MLQKSVAILGGLGLFCLTACQAVTAPQWRWERAEAGLPRQEVSLSLAVDPADPNRLWVGSYAFGGLATSHDGGQTWTTSETLNGIDDNPVFDLLALPSGELWAATRDGLLQSVDRGASWQPVAEGLPEGAVFALAADAGGRLYAGLDDAGVYAQAEAGRGWQSLAGDETLASAGVLSLAVSADGQQLYAGAANFGLFASGDGGQSWVNAYPELYVPNVALHPAKPAIAVASLRNRLVRTVDGGQSWHTPPVPWVDSEVFSFLWLADGSLGVGTGQGRLFLSRDNGDTWVEGGAGLPRGAVLDLAVAGGQSTPPRFLAATWTGVYASEDGGQTWAELAPSLGALDAHALLLTGQGLLLGAQAGLFRWQPDARQWLPQAEEVLPEGVASLAMATSDNQILYAGTTTGEGVARSEDGGTTWQLQPSLNVGIPALAVDPTDADHIYILAAWERVYESHDGGQAWLARWEGLGATPEETSFVEAVSLALDPLEPIAYLGGDAGLYRSENGADWELVAPSLADQSILALMVQPLPGPTGPRSVLYIGTTRGAYRSLDEGVTVQPSVFGAGWGRGLEAVSVTAFLADPHDPRRLYAGTAYNGVYQSVDWGHAWQRIGPAEAADQVVEDLAWGPDGELFIATAGGVWRGGRQ